MPVAGIEPFRGLTVGEQVRDDRVTVHGDADLAAMRLHDLAVDSLEGRQRAMQAIGQRMVVIADEGSHGPRNRQRA